jgi:arylsulfatase A-like enzyme
VGYRTVAIGKWHLGLEWSRRVGAGPWPDEVDSPESDPAALIDFTGPILRGPQTAGFDHSFVLPASLDMAPYCFIRDGLILAPPTERCEGSPRPQFWRGGPISPGFTHAGVMPRLTNEACEFLWDHHRARRSQPFFLAFCPTLPHYPHVPNRPFHGVSGCGAYGDGVVEFDASVGAILATLEATGQSENTVVIVTSDNGADLAGGQAGFGHASNAWWRGQKGDVYEGGHRVPFVARWPGVIPAGTISDATICLTDLFATIVDCAGATVPNGAAPDSVSIRPILEGSLPGTQLREAVVHHSMNGTFAVRSGPWKLATALGSGGFTAPRDVEPCAGGPTATLYHLGDDPEEKRNLFAKWPDEVDRLQRQLETVRTGS